MNTNNTFTPNSEIEMGSTGDPPVPSGHWPDGTERRFLPETTAHKGSRGLPPFRAASRRSAQASGLCYPLDVYPNFRVRVYTNLHLVPNLTPSAASPFH
jgi:hypothetical protein